MGLLEVEEADYNNASAAKQLLDKLSNNPKTRKQLLQLLKTNDPETPIPELDIAEPLQTDLQQFKSEVGNSLQELKELFESDSRKRSIEDTINSERRKLRKAGWDDEGISKVEDLMQKRGLTDYEAAAALVEKQMPRPDPMEPGDVLDRGWNITTPDDTSTDHQLLLKDPIAFQRAEIQRFLKEKRAAR
jgi:hypothetical protein